MKKNLVYILSIALLCGCLPENDIKKPFTGFTPPDLQDGWTISTPAAEQIDSSALIAVYQDMHNDPDLWQIRSLLVFRNGKLVSESYMKDDTDRVTPRAIWSCTKQIIAQLVGIAINQGYIASPGDSLKTYIPSTLTQYSDKQNITLRQLLTMRSGIAYSNDGPEGQTVQFLQQNVDDMEAFILSLPQNQQPGSTFAYNDGNFHLLSAVLQRATGVKTSEWAQDVLLSPMQVEHIRWEESNDHITFGGFGILTTPREMAKFGQCTLDSGKWQNQPLISPGYIQEMISPQVVTPYEGTSFGLGWWIEPVRNICFMDGHGGQYVFVNRAKNLLVVITAEPNTQGEFQLRLPDAFHIYDRVNQAAL